MECMGLAQLFHSSSLHAQAAEDAYPPLSTFLAGAQCVLLDPGADAPFPAGLNSNDGGLKPSYFAPAITRDFYRTKFGTCRFRFRCVPSVDGRLAHIESNTREHAPSVLGGGCDFIEISLCCCKVASHRTPKGPIVRAFHNDQPSLFLVCFVSRHTTHKNAYASFPPPLTCCCRCSALMRYAFSTTVGNDGGEAGRRCLEIS